MLHIFCDVILANHASISECATLMDGMIEGAIQRAGHGAELVRLEVAPLLSFQDGEYHLMAFLNFTTREIGDGGVNVPEVVI